MADLEEAQQVIASEEKLNTPHPFDNAKDKLKAKAQATAPTPAQDDDDLPF